MEVLKFAVLAPKRCRFAIFTCLVLNATRPLETWVAAPQLQNGIACLQMAIELQQAGVQSCTVDWPLEAQHALRTAAPVRVAELCTA
jgi:hypothetical protein